LEDASVLVVTPTDGFGGAEHYVLLILRALKEYGARSHLACPDFEATLPLVEGASSLAAFHPIPFIDPGTNKFHAVGSIASGYRQVAELITSINPRAVFLSLPSPNRGLGEMLAAVRAKVPLFVVFHYLSEDFRVGQGRQALYRLSRRGNVTWIAVSDANRLTLSTLFSGAHRNLFTIPNGVPIPDSSSLPSRADSKAEVTTLLGLPETVNLVVTVGRLTAQKGHRYLLPAAEMLTPHRPDLRFLWLGAGPDEAALRSAIARRKLEDSVLLLGHRADVQRFLLAADLYIMPSLAEGLPFALLEAMALGTPVAVSRCDVLTEVISAIDLGWTFDVADARAIACVIQEALDNPGRAIAAGRRGQQLVRENYTSERMLTTTLGYLATAVGA
jgi:glycosyltransferase involved in cell wall biosynthesis